MTIHFAASIVLGFVATASAFAAEPAPATTPVATATTTTAKAQPSENTRYCLIMSSPTSRIKTKTCGTYGDLTARGYDIDAALSAR